jgi:hypothetical protein
VQQHLIDQRVDGSCCSNAEHEREHGSNTEGRHPEKRACGEAEIISEIPQPSSQPDVSHFLFDLRDAPQFQQGLPSSFRSCQTGPLKIGDSPVEVVA